jgi:cytochrome c
VNSPRKFFLLLGALFGVAVVHVTLSSPGSAQTTAAGGRALFEKRCGGCHAMDSEKEGPRLGGVFNRPAGSVASFLYSAALRNSRITWNAETLDRWLIDPEKVVPGTDMVFRVEQPEERHDIIAYLKHVSGK